MVAIGRDAIENQRGDAVIIRARDSDAVARYLLNNTAARDLEITAHNLEDAFIALTGDDAPVPAGSLQ